MSAATIVVFVLPLGLDSFAVAAGLGALGPRSSGARWRITALFFVFEGGMPLIGLALGAPLATMIGGVVDYVAAAALIGLGAWMLRHDEGDSVHELAGRLATTHGVALLGLGVGVSMDEVAIGFSLGLTRLPLLPVIVAIGVQALLAAQLGLRVGTRIGELWLEWVELLAGVVLIALGLLLLAEHLLA